MKKLTLNRKIYVLSILSAFVVFYILYRLFSETSVLNEYFLFTGGKSDFIVAVTSSVFTQFAHADLLHLVTNGAFLFYTVYESSESFSVKRHMIISLFGVLSSAVMLLLFAEKDMVYVGASGWIGAALGAVLLRSITDNKKINSKNITLFCTSVLFLAVPLIIPQISVLMHFTGFFCGLLFELAVERIFGSK